ncbi:high-affinity choline transporter 1 [Dermacentor silvarum]|uniref:high-affinity choline transporter 1 n=1 Tax=Dermacentor silvarum TaxID=543639 RepID=UPI0021010BA9|nr:high-affinity choline transporter 1 [Dermacentor silvarum]
MAAVNMVALLFIILYYFSVMIVGVWGGRKVLPVQGYSMGPHGARISRRKVDDDDFLLRLFVANRHLPLLLGVASMTATWVGGGYLNGTAEAVYKYGIVNCQAPIGYAMSLILGGAFFATKMRLTDSLTMLDPFQTHYGRWTGLMFCVPACAGRDILDGCHTSGSGQVAVRTLRGDTASVIIKVGSHYFIIISALVIFFYTSLGGLFSVTYTDGLQLATTAILLWMCVPSCVTHKAVGTLGPQYTDWIGTVASGDISQLVDLFLMTALGGIPWQVYFQRVLACETVAEAKILSFMSAIGCIFLALPPVLIGGAAKHTNFTVAGYPGSFLLSDEDSPRVLPFAILYLTSGMTTIFGLVSIAAAVMSSADSSMLSASTMVTRNVYQALFRPMATETEVVIALRTMICALSSLSVYMALSVNSVFDLWTLCSDIVYVLLFPQLLCVFYFKETNAYGSVLAFVVSGVLRCLCGEPSMNVPVVVRLPLYDPELGQRFPFRLLCMALGLATLLLGSHVADALFRRGCFVKPPPTCARTGPSDHATAATGSTGSDIMPGAPSGTRHVSTTDTASEKEALTSGISKNSRRVSAEPPNEAQTGSCPTRRKSSLTSDRRRSSAMQSAWALQSSGAADKSLTEGATTETKTSRRKSKSGVSKRGGKETRS